VAESRSFKSRSNRTDNLNPPVPLGSRQQPPRACKNTVFTLQETGGLESLDHSPSPYKAAMASPEKSEWQRAMQDEIHTLQDERGCWQFVLFPRRQHKILRCHFVFKIKTKNGQVVRYKARLVIDGSGQVQGINYQETFAPVVKYASFACSVLSDVSTKCRYTSWASKTHSSMPGSMSKSTPRCTPHQARWAYCYDLCMGASRRPANGTHTSMSLSPPRSLLHASRRMSLCQDCKGDGGVLGGVCRRHPASC
jgi:hypothetical protein